MKQARNFNDVSWLFFACGSAGAFLWLAFNLRPPSFSGATATEVAQRAREATLQNVEQAIIAVGDPDTSQDQINARWQVVAGDHAAPTAVAKLAQKSCALRTWPVELREGSVDGTKVWVAVCGWPAPLGAGGTCICNFCNQAELDHDADLKNTEVVVVSDDPNPHLLAHVGREPLKQVDGIPIG